MRSSRMSSARLSARVHHEARKSPLVGVRARAGGLGLGSGLGFRVRVRVRVRGLEG